MTDGDLKIAMTESGGDIEVRGGQITMDPGLLTAVIVSLYTERNFWGNLIANSDSERIGQGYVEATSEPITADMLSACESRAQESLAWLVSEGLARSVDVTVSNPRADWIKTRVEIVKPSGDSVIWEGTVA